VRDFGAHLAHVRDASALLILGLVRARNHSSEPLGHSTQLTRLDLRQPPFEYADGYRAGESDTARAAGRRQTGVASFSSRPVTLAIVNVEELASMAQQPVVVKREHDRNSTLGERSNDRRREARQMMDVRHVWLEIIDDTACDGADGFVPVGLLESPGVAERVVHPHDAEAIARLGSTVVFGAVPILLAGENKNLVPAVAQGAGVRVRVHLGAALSHRRESMNHFENPHHFINFSLFRVFVLSWVHLFHSASRL
jgi:hypothetical protein